MYLPALADTLHRSIPAGDVLIMALPRSLGSRPVDAYEIIRAPALSWLVDRSFFWRTRSADLGVHAIHFRAAFPNDTVDTLTVQVTVIEP